MNEGAGELRCRRHYFYIREIDGRVRIVTKGLGHGYGLSIYGANEMAKEGKTYQEILSYYYSGLEITKKE